MSLINWHDDGHSGNGKEGIHMTIYLNDKWEWNWGGLFCWEDGQEHKVKRPQFNHGLTVSKGHQHCVTVLSPKAPVRKTLQIIITNYE
jgi:Rps23 Pro-64 3,4-dihydroxylase Tpa1-like proline 4-hydroxylase